MGGLGARAVLLAAVARLAAGPAAAETAPPPTFSRDVAPLLFEQCAPCHRPGEAAPFPLLTYDDARAHARQIAEITASRTMPPWLADPGSPPFVGERRLDEAQIVLLGRWAAAGAPEGDPTATPRPPSYAGGWHLGPPDLVLRLERPYTLPAEGNDVIRNFVIVVPPGPARWVSAVELKPANKRVTHHAILKIDRTRVSRRLDALDAEPGFPGMAMGNAEAPEGQMVLWSPGMTPSEPVDGAAFRLEPGEDLVLQLHCVPSGKPEQVDAEIGLHFTDVPPTRRTLALTLRDERLDIPAGEADYLAEDRFRLPVAADLEWLYPHAHYLGHDMRVLARAPSGQERTLLHIGSWDFNWQNLYRFSVPLPLEAGTEIVMRYRYDNSEHNPRNPHFPPRRVVGGNRSEDEMATLGLQLAPHDEAGRRALLEAFLRKTIDDDPRDAVAHYNLAVALADAGGFDEAAREYERALELDPSDALAWRNLGNVRARLGRDAEAERAFREALRREPRSAELQLALGRLLLRRGDRAAAAAALRRAAALDPGLVEAHYELGNVLLAEGDARGAAEAFGRAVEADPRRASAQYNLAVALTRVGDLDGALRHLRLALEADPAHARAHYALGLLLERAGDAAGASEHLRRARELDPALGGDRVPDRR